MHTFVWGGLTQNVTNSVLNLSVFCLAAMLGVWAIWLVIPVMFAHSHINQNWCRAY